MSKSSFSLFVLGAGCVAGFIIWSARSKEPAITQDKGSRPAAVAVPAPTAATPADTPLPPLSAEAQALLAALQRLLETTDRRANEGLLTFKDDEALRRFAERAAKAGLSVLGQVDALRTVRVRYDDLNAFRRELAENASDYADLSGNALMHLPHGPTREERAALDLVPFGNRTLEFVGATGDRSPWGRGVTVAILDTGVAADPTFGSGRLRTLDIGFGAAPGTNANDGHGTGVAALAAGGARDAGGVAPAANLLSIRVTDATGTSDIFTVAHAIVTAVDAGAKIVNVSLGGYSTNATLDAAIGYAHARGALIVAAAGNDQAAQLAWPAADPRVLSVGAVDAAEQQVTFSNSGPQLQLSAPGYGVQTAWLGGQRVTVDGTSASAPLVAGAVAALMSQNSSLTPQQAAQILVQTANDSGAPGADPAYGNGILNLGWAMNHNNSSYVDTAVASHTYDAASNQMQFLVQNRSGRLMSGMSLNANIGGKDMRWTVPPLAPGATFAAHATADAATLKTNGSIRYTTELANPPGVSDQVPSNNRRSSVLTAPAKP